jgi:hypothetical protein
MINYNLEYPEDSKHAKCNFASEVGLDIYLFTANTNILLAINTPVSNPKPFAWKTQDHNI